MRGREMWISSTAMCFMHFHLFCGIKLAVYMQLKWPASPECVFCVWGSRGFVVFGTAARFVGRDVATAASCQCVQA
jgi:hypothetical protein